MCETLNWMQSANLNQGRKLVGYDAGSSSSLHFVCSVARREGGEWKMADGVDHIDIYADVEEEFNQVCISITLLFSDP